MKNLLSGLALSASALALVVSCSPLESKAVRQNDRIPVYTRSGERNSGGNFTGFAPSNSSAIRYTSSSAPC